MGCRATLAPDTRTVPASRPARNVGETRKARSRLLVRDGATVPSRRGPSYTAPGPGGSEQPADASRCQQLRRLPDPRLDRLQEARRPPPHTLRGCGKLRLEIRWNPAREGIAASCLAHSTPSTPALDWGLSHPSGSLILLGWTSPLGPLPCSGISLEISLGRAFLLYSSFPELLTGFSVRNLSSAFELWCWRRLLRVPCTARRPNQSILKGINPEYSLKGLMLKLKLQYFGHLMQRADSLEKSLMLGKIESGRKRG